MIGQVISDDICLAGFDESGNLRTLKGLTQEKKHNIFYNRLEDILRDVMAKTTSSISIGQHWPVKPTSLLYFKYVRPFTTPNNKAACIGSLVVLQHIRLHVNDYVRTFLSLYRKMQPNKIYTGQKILAQSYNPF